MLRTRSTQTWEGLDDVVQVDGVAELVLNSASQLQYLVEQGKSVSLDAAAKIKMSLDILTALHERDTLITPSQWPTQQMDG